MMTAGCWACADRAMRDGDVCDHCGAMADAHGVLWKPLDGDASALAVALAEVLRERHELQRQVAEARREERAAIVAWLRSHDALAWADAEHFAEGIEGGAHEVKP